MALEAFSPATQAWFETTFAAPTAAQAEGWPAIAAGQHTLILAPTGSGKTLTAFLWGIDRVLTTPAPAPQARTRIVYVSPLRALAVDVEKNLRAPLAGITLAAERLGLTTFDVTVGVRTGDTPTEVRRNQLRHPQRGLGLSLNEGLANAQSTRPANSRLDHLRAARFAATSISGSIPFTLHNQSGKT